jgi:DNA-3-methyladenine glycosylase II
MQDITKTLKEAELWLSDNDPKLGEIIATAPALKSSAFKKTPFEALVHAVISQQLSVKSAAAIRKRVHALLPKDDVTPNAFSLISTEQFKSAGMSAAKTRTVETLIEFAITNNHFDALNAQSNQDVKRTLCALKGIGPWTVDIFLMFGLKRLDIFAPGDLGLRKAIKLLLNLDQLPSATECNKISQRWQPYRTVAAWYLWRTVD